MVWVWLLCIFIFAWWASRRIQVDTWQWQHSRGGRRVAAGLYVAADVAMLAAAVVCAAFWGLALH